MPLRRGEVAPSDEAERDQTQLLLNLWLRAVSTVVGLVVVYESQYGFGLALSVTQATHLVGLVPVSRRGQVACRFLVLFGEFILFCLSPWVSPRL
jgi:hypothetical protein